ncbi:ISAzo13 family transposase [Chloroflexota bacterium]
MTVSDDLKMTYKETAQVLKGSDRRMFMGRIVNALGRGGQTWAQHELGWCRDVIRKGQRELEKGPIQDNFAARGRNRTEKRLPKLLADIRAIVDGQSQTDPTFQSQRLYTRLTVKEVRQQLVKQKGYTDEELPCEDAIRHRINALGYTLRSVQKRASQKKIAETDDIFEELTRQHEQVQDEATVLRISMDVKATVAIGEFSRGGRSRVEVKALDHDFKPDAKLVPVGIFLPDLGETYLYFVSSKATSDCLVDCLEMFWQSIRHRFPQVITLLIDLDNGTENHSRRTQFMKRIVDFADTTRLTVQLVYYPPYHSKYNPIERVWGGLEQHWNGSLLDTIDTALKFARSLVWRGCHPVVQLITKPYPTGVCLTPQEMEQLEQRLERLPSLPKWFVRITPLSI